MLTPELQDALHEFAVDPPRATRAVLVVDDEPENLEVLNALLEGEYEVYTATSAAVALEVLASGATVDLVIADQRMPAMTGVELLARIASERPDTVRIVLTAYDDVGPMMEAINRGAVFRFLVKPCAPEELLLAVREGLEVKEGAALLRHLVRTLVERQDALDRAVWDLHRTQDQLLAAERLTTMGRAASGVIHNVRNLGTIVSFLVREVQSSMACPAALTAGRLALQGFGSLVTLLESVREFARTNDADLELSPTEMDPFLRQIVAVALLQQSDRRCPVDVEVDPSLAWLSIDRVRVRHAVTAVLSNALHASRAGEPILIRVVPHQPHPTNGAAQPRWACIEVRDQGIGMDAGTLSMAAEPLFSGFDPPGLGLGLSAARLTAAIHGGELELASTLGQGTCARLILPERDLAEVRAPVPSPVIPDSPIDPAVSRFGFTSSERAPLRVWVAPDAWRLLAPELADSPTWGSLVKPVTAQDELPTGPAVLVFTDADLKSSYQTWLRALAHAAAPGRPVVIGGADDRRTLLQAINEWRAYRLLPHGTPMVAVLDAIRRAHEMLTLDIAVRVCARELLDGCRRLATTVAELEATQERLLHAERLATVGRIVGALMNRMGEQSQRLEAFWKCLSAESASAGAPASSRLRKEELLACLMEAHQSFDALLADMLALAEDRPPDAEVRDEDLDALVQRTVRLFHYDPLGRERDIRVGCSSQAWVRVDGNRVRHALLNLLRNAAQATEPGAQIHVRAMEQGGAAVVEVEDSGEGMSRETLQQIFTPFFTTKGASGMGLGLRLSRAAIEGHGGTLECTSTLGGGTKFSIRLPTRG